ncbi:hypothetical protein FH832_003102 [Listeria monocytogenes]|nr:hypothetical protein [Listeria monocytogenes]
MAEIKVKKLFTETEKVIAAYKEEAEKLDQQESELTAELEALQLEMTANILAQENAGVSDLVYLKIQAKEINHKAEVIAVLLEELKQNRVDLKLKYVPLLRQSQGVDGKVRAEYDINAIVDKYKWLMFTEIAGIGKQVLNQYSTIAPDLMEILDDREVTKVHPRVMNQFSSESYKPTFWQDIKTVVHREDIRLACSGSLPQGLKQPKDVK